MKPARAAPAAPASVALTSSGPALRNVCSASMISSTATAKPAPLERVNSPSSSEGAVSRTASIERALRPSASGTTASDSRGAAAMPSATTAWPEAMPTVTASANMQPRAWPP